MGSGALPLILLLMSFIHAGLTQESPKAVLKVTPDESVFSGETVTLTCDIQGAGHIQWRFSWFRDGNTFYPYTTTTAAEISFTAYVSSSGEYSCRGDTYNPQRSSHISAAVTLTVSDSSRSSLTVTPDSPVFTGETVNLKCVIETRSYSYSYRDWIWRIDQTYNWRYEWYKDSVMLQTSGRYTVNRDTLTIRGVITSDQGQYWCRGQRDQRPNSSRSAVNLTVTDSPRSSLTVTPDSPVFTGDTVNLTCVIETHSNWRYEWYKDTDSVMLQTSGRYTVNRDTLTIRGVITSDQGQYWCRGQRDQRPNSSQDSNRIHLSVNVSDSSSFLLVTAVVVGSSVFLLIFISLLLLWRYKKNKDQQRNINQTSVPNQSAESQPENFPLQSDADHVYDDVTEVKKRHKDDPETKEVTYSEILWSYVDKDVSMAESNDATYSEVIKKVKKCKDADAGVGDTTYASVRKKGSLSAVKTTDG
ncbi:basement membrane-specific heparan sulfate proteoglycan core protein-like isoform X4 [Carassius auratus]|uniref:Basement membrane-specific heparan sulfate proteoglycan core protein-like isoform X4 n=1 Tax=Carassius auratus TaxID=7957 RepID=A0A6P6PMG6_CARAU|nr:basement membrane-specific heparan sulfate proteoglycan core protein-like isoform X4 [Carassius auratus]